MESNKNPLRQPVDQRAAAAAAAAARRAREEPSVGSLDVQIAALLAQKEALVAKEERRKRESNVLVGASPSPRKKVVDFRPERKRHHDSGGQPKLKAPKLSTTSARPLADDRADLIHARPSSNFADALEASRKQAKSTTAAKAIVKTSSFTAKPAETTPFASARASAIEKAKADAAREKAETALGSRRYDVDMTDPSRAEEAPARNEDLTVATRVPVGPIHFNPSASDPTFESIEPNSGTRLSARSLAHEDLQAYLSDRHVLRGPGSLYSVVKKNGRGGWEVPVVGDWVVIGVIGERSGIRHTNVAGSSSTQQPRDEKQAADEDEEERFLHQGDDADGTAKKNKRKRDPSTAASSRRYLSFKLLDLGSSSRHSSTSSGAVANVLLFEASSTAADEFDAETSTRRKTYSGGSGGAYELLWKEQGGAVVALLNPRILPPRTGEVGEVLGLTPESRESVVVIGRAKDLGSCRALRRDTGKECGGWVDLRKWDGGKKDAVCEWHVKNQVNKVRASRPEMFSATSGMQMFTGAKFGTKPVARSSKPVGFDPETKTGLLPRTDGTASINGSVTYVVGGSSTSASASSRRRLNGRPDGLSLSRFEEARDEREREGAKVRAKRQRLEEAEMVKMLDGEKKTGVGSVGGKYVEQARRVRQEAKRKEELKLAKLSKGRPAPSRPSVRRDDKRVVEEGEEGDEREEKVKKRKAFSAAAVRAFGFDPTRRAHHHHRPASSSDDGEPGGGPSKGIKGQAKEAATRELLEGRKHREFEVDQLAFPQGELRRRSGVSAPKKAAPVAAAPDRSDEDDLVIEPKRRSPAKARPSPSKGSGQD